MMKILLPASFIALKLTGTFIDFMLGLSNSEVNEEKDFETAKSVQTEFDLQQNITSLASEDSKTATTKKLLGSKIVESFSFRTCVNPKLTKQDSGETKIVYQSLTAQKSLQNNKRPAWDNKHLKTLVCSILKLSKFEESDEGLPCVNTIEKLYIGLLITVFILGIISLFRLTHFKAELQKVFDSRKGLPFLQAIIYDCYTHN